MKDQSLQFQVRGTISIQLRNLCNVFPEPRYWHHECYQQQFEASKGYCKGRSDKKDHLRKILISFNLWFKKRT